MYLFSGSTAFSIFETCLKAMNNRIEGLSDEQILNSDMNKLANTYLSDCTFNPISLFTDSKNITTEKIKMEDEHGIKFNFEIPFCGDRNLLNIQPSTFTHLCYYIENVIEPRNDEYGKIIFSLTYKMSEIENQDKCFIDNEFNKKFKNYIQTIEELNKEFENFSNKLEDIIIKALLKRKNQAERYIGILEKLNIPLKINPNAPNTMPIKINKIIKRIEIPKTKTLEDEYCISDSDYENIKKIINLASISFERAATTFSKLEEEELRDVILSNLNTHYENMAHGETFSKKGKTDIYIQFENKAAYIAELKIWQGEKHLREAIQQLFSYITWRDFKTSLIIFNKKNKDFDNILNSIDNFIKNNTLCKKHVRKSNNEWQCDFKKDEESQSNVLLNIMVFDICIK